MPDLDFAQNYPLRILIADDNYINRRVLSFQLKRLGYTADTTENGRECLRAIHTHPYDLLLTDIDMPEMSGIECAESLRDAKNDLIVVAVTTHSPSNMRKRCLDAGMSDYLMKPVGMADLKRVLEHAFMERMSRFVDLLAMKTDT